MLYHYQLIISKKKIEIFFLAYLKQSRNLYKYMFANIYLTKQI